MKTRWLLYWERNKTCSFSSENPDNPAKFYISCVPAHHKYPNVKLVLMKLPQWKRVIH